MLNGNPDGGMAPHINNLPHLYPAAPGGGGGSGSTPPPSIQVGGTDASSYITGDPSYQALQAALKGNEDSYNSQMRASIQREALQAGYDVPGLSQFLDAGMEGQIANNPYSQAALMKQQHATNLRAIQNQLAARGGYNSGELPYGLGNENQNFNINDLHARAALQDFVSNLLGQQAQMKSSDASQLAQALGAATDRQLQLHPQSDASTATWNQATGTYTDANGNHYDANGNPVAVANASTESSPYSWGFGGKQ